MKIIELKEILKNYSDDQEIETVKIELVSKCKSCKFYIGRYAKPFKTSTYVHCSMGYECDSNFYESHGNKNKGTHSKYEKNGE